MRTNFLPTAAVSLAGLLMLHAPARAAGETLFDFDADEMKSSEWRIVNDGVMGGLSKGQMGVSEDGVLNFSGDLSLENNGGFSSIRTRKLEMDLGEAEGLVLRVRGDGRKYQWRFNTDARFRGMEVSFMAEFPTKEGKWTEVKVPFSDFTGSFRGMKLKDEKFDPSKISRAGLLLADKKEGPFELEVDWVRTYGGEDGAKNLVETALADGRFSILAKALTAADFVDFLQADGEFTVFAPTDEAFKALPKGTLETLLKPGNREKLQAILKYHVLKGSTDLASALSAGEAESILGEPLAVGFSKGRVRVNDAAVVDADVRCSNGIIHVIDSVLLPPEPANDIASVAKRAGNFTTLLAAIEAAGLTGALSGEGPLTVFAPTDEAFKALPKGTVESLLEPDNRERLTEILTLHATKGKVSAGDALNAGKAKALSGESLNFGIVDGRFEVNGVTILKTDIKCDNGVIHVLDAVLLPPSKRQSSKGDCEDGCETAMHPTERIEAAIERGVPIFNGGDHAKCATIYRECLLQLSTDGSIDKQVAQAMRSLIERADDVSSATERAWILRRGLDHVHAAYERR
ncbi:CIA30 family protein [Haloferula sp. A504]|uniref:CIA30 family protein n=1 Tax=Haloferula sp. A504 TaxID=3373601 RepID=UPI0031BC9DFF|nr:CIA30 family protein [Verrucomicrobiaceae bacterium E54]